MKVIKFKNGFQTYKNLTLAPTRIH